MKRAHQTKGTMERARRQTLGAGIAVSIAALSLGGIGCATPTGQARHHPAEHSTQVRDLTLYEVTRAGQPTSYLFGTCHMGISLVQMLPAKYEALLSEEMFFVGEIDVQDSSLNPDLLELPDDQTLSEYMGEEKWSEVVDVLEIGPAATKLDRMHPFVLLGISTQKGIANQMSETAGIGVDQELRAIARDRSLTTAWLETPAEQLAMMKSLPMEQWIEVLHAMTGPEFDTKRDESMTRMLDACSTGEAKKFLIALQKMDSEEDAFDEWKELLTTKRNQNWTPKLDTMFSEGPHFVAVGALHLYGDQGLVELLEQRGYTVRQLKGVTASSPMVSQSAFLQQTELQYNAMFCTETGVIPQCTGATPKECKWQTAANIRDCTAPAVAAISETAANTATRMSPQAAAKFGQELGICLGLKNSENLLRSMPQAKPGPGCRAALESLQEMASQMQL